jgi:predicted nuclease of predicted toxin-antitoxin system
MRVLFDECLDERLRNHLRDQDCQTVRYAGLAGLKNGDLLTAAENAGFHVFLTLDQGIEYQQNLIDRKIAIIIFRAKSSRLKDLLPLIPACLTTLESIRVGQLVRIESSGG